MSKVYISDDPQLERFVLQWHPTKNGIQTPDNTQKGSGRTIWWQCSNYPDHEWTAMPLARISQSQGCPYCSNRRVLNGFNDLATLNPTLMLDWHPTKNTEFTPFTVAPSANKKAWWLGKDCGHEWEATINSRNSGNKCPYCSNRKILSGFNDLVSDTRYTKVVTEWHPTRNLELTPSTVAPASNKKVWWQCSDGHEWETSITNRTMRGSNCPVCAKKKPKVSLITVADSSFGHEWSDQNEKTAKQMTLGSNKIGIWVCAINAQHVWKATISNRARGSGCRICSNQEIMAGINDLASSLNHQYLVQEWHPNNQLKPTEVGIGTDITVKWKCVFGHEWNANIYSRSTLNHGCPECLGRTKQGETRFKVSDYPALASQWHAQNDLTPEKVSFRSAKIIIWQCSKESNHVWSATPASRSLDGNDCPVCAGRLVLSGVNDLASIPENAKLVVQWHPDNIVQPTEVTAGSNLLVKWLCDKDAKHVWTTTVSSRTRKDASGCPNCALARSSSKGEEEVFAILTLLGVDPIANVTNVIRSRELDIYIPSKKFAIEFNGLYWHSEAIRPDKMYHANKNATCIAKGVYLYSVWEDDWSKRRDIVIRGLAHRLGATDKLPLVLPHIPSYWYEKIGGRKTTISMLSTVEARDFLETHHIQGFTAGKYYLGLRDMENRLRATLVLSTTNKTGELRIDRYATAGTVVGGFTKLLAYAERNFPVESWLTFADLAISDGSLYENNGFVLDKVLAVDYSYLSKSQRVHKFNYRVQRFKKDRELLYQDGMTEKELADLNNLYRIWDFGKNRYIKIVNK